MTAGRTRAPVDGRARPPRRERVFTAELPPAHIPDSAPEQAIVVLSRSAQPYGPGRLVNVHHLPEQGAMQGAVAAALGELARPGIHAAALHYPRADLCPEPERTGLDLSPERAHWGFGGRMWLALRVAAHLTRCRQGGPAPGPCPTTPDGNLKASATITIPHLVAVTTQDGVISDHAMWEIMPVERARAWLGGHPLPASTWCVSRLPGLLRLRAQLRTRFIDPAGGPAGAGAATCDRFVALADLHDALAAEGRYLSILFALTHPGLINAALDDLDEVAP